ncbi:MAG: hypothetical protein AMJ81_02770 [Phycisphaerae bacterium SM23_33]|jgi:dTMP kinase|nr:MAG: hypothetical protein AMJ81_02770 [Phycisphaerae bacterium SM23_33]
MGELGKSLAGKFIVLDGPDGSGKTTQLDLLAEHLASHGADVQRAHDPGGTAVGEKIRQILLDRDNGPISATCETMLFMASRAQLVAERIRPALEAGKVVLCDRFISATVAYQGASGVDPKSIIEIGNIAVQGVWPDLTVILDVPVDVGMRRIGVPRGKRKRAGESGRSRPLFGDRMETRESEYHESVRANFLKLCRGNLYPRPVVRVDGNQDTQRVFTQILARLERAFGPRSGSVPIE